MKQFELTYTIGERDSWRSKEGLQIKSNLADDKLVECDIAKSLVDSLKEGSAILDADKLLLEIAEAQKREIVANIEEMDELALRAKIQSDKAHEKLLNISEDAEKKFLEIEKKFSATEKSFSNRITQVTNRVKGGMDKLISFKQELDSINNFSLDNLTKTLQQIITLFEKDPELVKLILEHKKDNLNG